MTTPAGSCRPSTWGGDEKKAHSAVQPGKSSPQGGDGAMLYEPVWRYLFTHDVDQVGTASPKDPGCQQDHPLGR